MGIKGPMPPNTLRVSNIGEGVSQEDLHRLFSNFGRLECIEFETSTCALVKFINFYHAREALENLQDTKMEGRELTIVWNEVQTPSISSKVWIRIDGPFLDDQELNDLFSVYGFVRQCEFSGRRGKTRGAVSFELDSAADSAVHDLNGTTLYGRKFYVAKFVRNMGDVVAALDHTAAQEPIKFASIYKFEGMQFVFVAAIEMDSIRTVADFLLELHDLWGSPLAGGLSLNCPWPGYHARYYHANSMTYEPVLVEEVDMFNEDDPFTLWFLSSVNRVVIHKEGFLSNVEGLKGVQHVVLLSQLSAYRGSGGIQALMKSNARKLAEQDESLLMASGIPYTIIRAGLLQSAPGGQQGFSFEEGSAARGNLSKEDAAFICVQAPDAVPQRGFIFEVVNGDEKISDLHMNCITINQLMDVEKKVFDLVHSSDDSIYSLSQRSDDVKCLYFSQCHGGLNIWDERIGKCSTQWNLHEHRINSIDFNSENYNNMATISSDGIACIWDLRSINVDQLKTLKKVNHKRVVQSAYFSLSGSSLTTTRDNTVGIVTGVNFNHTSMIKHDDQSGDSMSYFRAIWGWDDSHIFIGNIKRGVDVTSLPLEKTIFTLQSPHTCQLFYADLMHTLQLLACLQEPLVWAGLYVDIGLATSVSFCET